MSQRKHTIEPGMRFGKLIVVERSGTYRYPCGARDAAWRCLCDCGRGALVPRREFRTRVSCGCERVAHQWKRGVQGNLKHGESIGGKITTEYSIWRNMVNRCRNPSSNAFKNYGGRGITVCDRWMTFGNFLADMGRRPPGLSIERKDNDKGYSPDNCKWATAIEQAQNTRKSTRLTFNGETKTIRQWAIYLSIPYTTLKCRVKWFGWSVERALTTPAKGRRFSNQVRTEWEGSRH